MSSRGRGYGGRGGYNSRGSSYRGSYRGSSRGSYEGGRGGRGGYSSYSNDNRYNSGDRYGSGRDRMDDSFKKSYRSDGGGYSSREYGRSGSPERKRMRTEGGERRSHDGGGHYGSSYGSRQDTYVSERRTFDDRRRSSSRDGYRKSMAPPRSPSRLTRPRVSRAPRRSFRGRSLRTRAPFRTSIRTRGSYSRPTFTKSFRSMKSSSVKSKGDSASSTEEDWDADEKEVEEEEKIEVKKSPKAKDGEQVEDEEEVAGDDGEETDKGEGGGSEGEEKAAKRTARSLTKGGTHYVCIHCKEKAITSTGYIKHLLLSKHRAAMSVVARRHKSQLIRMRLQQRRAQREIEVDGDAPLASRTTFCPVCRLNYRTTRHAHNMSDSHRAMKRFLNPNCRVCRMTFRSPMVYEHHLCQIEHIKRKLAQARHASPKAEGGSGDEGMDVDLDNFMTLDSVGDVDEVDDDSGGEKKGEESTQKLKKPKVEINIGSEHIKKMEVWFCELCRVYLPRAEAGSVEETEARRRHCRLRMHLGRYVQHRDTRTLRKHAERIHRQLHQQKEAENASDEKEVKVEKAEGGEEKKKLVENGTSDNSVTVGDDKLWADVDKDIGDLLREVDPQDNEGTDDEADLDRYEKFRKSDQRVTLVDGDANESIVKEKKVSVVDTST